MTVLETWPPPAWDYRNGWKEKDPRSIEQWAADELRLKNSPFGNRFVPELTPWLIEPMREFTDNRNREITCQCCVQGGKTVLMQLCAAWAIRHEPAPMMFNCQTNDDAKEFANERLGPMLETHQGISSKLPEIANNKKSICNWSFSDMFLIIQGANKSNLQSKSIRWLFNDEVWLWKHGLLDEARKRATQFWNRRIFNASTAGEVGEDLHEAFEAGDKRTWHLRCPSCNELFEPLWKLVRYPEIADDAEPDFEAIRTGTRLRCPHCWAEHRHTERIAKAMNAGAEFVAMNSNPTPRTISFHWNALSLSPATLSWGDLAVEWVKARIRWRRGEEVPLREFIQKRLGESWDPNKYADNQKFATPEDDGDWPKGRHRFMTVDVQELEYYVTIRLWAEDGESRLLFAGCPKTWDEVCKLREDFNVPKPNVLLDSGYNTRNVYRLCITQGTAKKRIIVDGKPKTVMADGFKAMKGEQRDDYVSNGRRTFFVRKVGDPHAGRGPEAGIQCELYLWSNPSIKDILKRLRDGKGASWLSYEGAPESWSASMYSERRNPNKVGRPWEQIGSRPNHYWDCECMQVAAACIAGIFTE